MNMKKIVFLSRYIYNYFHSGETREFGGVSRIYRLVTRLSRFGDYRIVCYVGDYGQAPVENRQGIQLVKTDVGKKRYFYRVVHRLITERPDLVVEFYASPQVFLLGVLKKICRQRFVFFSGSDIDVNGGYRYMTNFLFYMLYAWGLKQADQVVCQTRDQAHALKRTYGIEGVTVLSPYVDITPAQPCEKKTVLWVGRAAEYKRPDLFIRLARDIPEEKFLMICNPSPHGRQMQDMIDREGHGLKNLEVVEAVPFDRIRTIYAGAKLLINTSDFEGFPNTFIEAALEKTPVVSLNVDPNAMLSKYGCGVFCRHSYRKMVDEVKNLSGNDVLRRTMGENAAGYARQNHDLSGAVLRIKAVLDRVLAG